MKLEAGKRYVQRNQQIATVIGPLGNPSQVTNAPFTFAAQDDDGVLFKVKDNGRVNYGEMQSDSDLVREFREPVVHERWVAMIRRGEHVFFSWATTEQEVTNWAGRPDGTNKVIGIQKVTFTEEQP
jgi:DUF2075 family protein